MHTAWPPNGSLSEFIVEQFDPGYQGHCIDVGASDGISVSSTYVLETSHRWTVLCVEANPGFGPMLKKRRGWVELCACDDKPGEAEFSIYEANWESYSSLRPTSRPDLYPTDGAKWKRIIVPVRTVDQLLEKWEFPKLDALCIDVEGTELDVLKGCDLNKWRPRVIVTECWDPVGPIDLYLSERGYKKTARNVHNDIFLREI